MRRLSTAPVPAWCAKARGEASNEHAAAPRQSAERMPRFGSMQPQPVSWTQLINQEQLTATLPPSASRQERRDCFFAGDQYCEALHTPGTTRAPVLSRSLLHQAQPYGIISWYVIRGKEASNVYH